MFVDSANYSGTPDLLRTKILRDWIDKTLGEDTRRLSSALWIPVGPKPAKALRYLADRGLIDRAKILDGLPHPSGANGERICVLLTGSRVQRSRAGPRPIRSKLGANVYATK